MVAKDWVWHAPKCLEHVLKAWFPEEHSLWRSDKISKRWSLGEDVQVKRGHLKGHCGDTVSSSFSLLSDVSHEQFSSATYLCQDVMLPHRCIVLCEQPKESYGDSFLKVSCLTRLRPPRSFG